MDDPKAPWLRDNAPLVGVLAIVVLAFVVMALLRAAQGPAPAPSPSGRAIVPPVEALPATAEEDGTVASVLAPDDARSRNAAVPIDPAALSPARAFAFNGRSADRVRARDCLALAAMAEAGGGDPDQRAVMQVVLNRVRHPAFANTVCGVVFEGSERPTGCQFTFTCDGSLARSYSPAMWRAARTRAEEALGGYVEKRVGTATHYHADYVYPYWSPSLDKVAAIGPHLFFRWRGWWGTRGAFAARYGGNEPDPMALRSRAQSVDREDGDLTPASLAETGEAIRSITAGADGDAVDGSPDVAAAPAIAPLPLTPSGSPKAGVHFVLVSASDDPTTLVGRSRALCPGEAFCQIYGWSDAGAMPTKLPLDRTQRASLAFAFLAARAGNPEVIFFDCRLFPSPAAGRCLPRARP
ncbi:cell wall hydrolase [Qipengyuania sp. XHP0207]|uniref:cell wall hydrolase n=1 Tax=Qipengyuania sp. XHP0207 TaxID=3038078 RepID=UPI00241C0493|nr:cell wall hydrolase [Qipengyuania sp. XHP0207]MDG5747126.1 cell wall hydrolase [Qipengyuania sp. XHP0207]